jgi:hypothetical protein
LFRYNALFREGEALLLDSQIQWMLFTTIAIWCFLFIIFRFKLDDAWLVGLLLIATVMFFKNYLSAFQPTKAIILLTGVTLGKGGAFFFNNRNSCGVSGHSFTFVQSSGIQRELILILILLFSLSSWWHLDMVGSIYHGARWMGLWNNPNGYGLLMGAGLVLAIGLLVERLKAKGKRLKAVRGENVLRSLRSFAAIKSEIGNRKSEIVLFVAAGMMGTGLLFSYSRGAWAGTAVGLLYLAKVYGKFKWRYLFPAIFIAAAVVWFFWNTPRTAPWY